jgi:formylglycine-generating enzyme required for sulfatase activity
MTRFTSIFMVLALICVSAVGCGEDDPAAPKDEPETTGTIVVDRSPNTLSCTWQLTGPDSYLHNGTDDETLEDIEPGNYTLTWTEMSGWNCPSPLSETKAVAAGGTTTFTGTYILQAGSITIDPEPNAINAPWTLTGPSSYSHIGTGDETIPGLTPGTYTITWGAVTGWDLPDPATEALALADGGTVTFSGTYTEQTTTGTVHVSPMPYSAREATWHLDGPGGYSYDGQGDEYLYSMDAGDYTVTWNEFAGHTSPDPISETATLAGGETINLYGTYVAQEGSITINSMPAGIDAPWHIDGPGGYSRDGVGYQSQFYVPIGDYTITWGAVDGWDPPGSEVLPVILNEITRFVGRYTLIWDPALNLITGGKFEMGSPDTELGRDADETQHWVELSDFYMSTTEVTQAEFASLIPGYTFSASYMNRAVQCEWIEAVRFCNALSARDGLDSVYTIDSNGFDAAWDMNADGYRLPTEAEWEYACRAGAATAFANGEITNETCGDPVLNLIGWYCGNTSENSPVDVATLIANAWGLYDMHGNTSEWCWDRGQSSSPPPYGTGTFENPDIDPTGNGSSDWYRVRRGAGSMSAPRQHDARDCRSAARSVNGSQNSDYGFRIVRNAQ